MPIIGNQGGLKFDSAVSSTIVLGGTYTVPAGKVFRGTIQSKSGTVGISMSNGVGAGRVQLQSDNPAAEQVMNLEMGENHTVLGSLDASFIVGALYTNA